MIAKTTPLVVLLAGLVLSGCAAPAADPASDACEEVVAQASYEAMRGLAAGGAAADPEGLRDAIPGTTADDGIEVDLPPYDEFLTRYDDGERAQILSALSSSLIGVGETFDQDAFLAATDTSGPCAGWAP